MIYEKQVETKKVKDPRTSAIEPLLYGKCPNCNGYVSIYMNSSRVSTVDVCPWCYQRISWGMEKPLTPEQMNNYPCRQKIHN